MEHPVLRLNRAMTKVCCIAAIMAIIMWLTTDGIEKQIYSATFPILGVVFVAIMWLERTIRPTLIHSVLLTILAIPILGALIACVVIALWIFAGAM
jgi:hypothetical protein